MLRKELPIENKTDEVSEPAPEEPDSIVSAFGPLEKVPGVFPVPIAIHEDQSGDIWTSTVQDVTELKGGSIAESAKKLNKSIYDKLFKIEQPPITASYLDEEGDVWIGSIDGQVMRYASARYDWKIAFESGEPIRDHIKTITRAGPRVYIGTAKGLWKWDLGTGKLTRFKGFNGMVVSTLLTTPKGDVVLGSGNGVWRLTERGWEQSFALPPGHTGRGILSLSLDAAGNVLAGTERGLIRLSEKGVALERLLTSQSVSASTDIGGGRLLVGTEKGGLAYYDGKALYGSASGNGMPGDMINTVLRDRSGRLWIGVTGHGVFTANEADLLDWLKAAPLSGADRDENAPKT